MNLQIDRLYRIGLLTVANEGEDPPKYTRTADNITPGNKLTDYFDGNIYDHWILGLINHMENNFIDLLKRRLLLTRVSNDSEASFKELGYTESTFSNFTIYLTPEEVKELSELIDKFRERHKEKPAENSRKRPYELSVLLHPDLTKLHNLLKKE